MCQFKTKIVLCQKCYFLILNQILLHQSPLNHYRNKVDQFHLQNSQLSQQSPSADKQTNVASLYRSSYVGNQKQLSRSSSPKATLPMQLPDQTQILEEEKVCQKCLDFRNENSGLKLALLQLSQLSGNDEGLFDLNVKLQTANFELQNRIQSYQNQLSQMNNALLYSSELLEESRQEILQQSQVSLSSTHKVAQQLDQEEVEKLQLEVRQLRRKQNENIIAISSRNDIIRDQSERITQLNGKLHQVLKPHEIAILTKSDAEKQNEKLTQQINHMKQDLNLRQALIEEQRIMIKSQEQQDPMSQTLDFYLQKTQGQQKLIEQLQTEFQQTKVKLDAETKQKQLLQKLVEEKDRKLQLHVNHSVSQPEKKQDQCSIAQNFQYQELNNNEPNNFQKELDNIIQYFQQQVNTLIANQQQILFLFQSHQLKTQQAAYLYSSLIFKLRPILQNIMQIKNLQQNYQSKVIQKSQETIQNLQKQVKDEIEQNKQVKALGRVSNQKEKLQLSQILDQMHTSQKSFIQKFQSIHDLTTNLQNQFKEMKQSRVKAHERSRSSTEVSGLHRSLSLKEKRSLSRRDSIGHMAEKSSSNQEKSDPMDGFLIKKPFLPHSPSLSEVEKAKLDSLKPELIQSPSMGYLVKLAALNAQKSASPVKSVIKAPELSKVAGTKTQISQNVDSVSGRLSFKKSAVTQQLTVSDQLKMNEAIRQNKSMLVPSQKLSKDDKTKFASFQQIGTQQQTLQHTFSEKVISDQRQDSQQNQQYIHNQEQRLSVGGDQDINVRLSNTSREVKDSRVAENDSQEFGNIAKTLKKKNTKSFEKDKKALKNKSYQQQQSVQETKEKCEHAGENLQDLLDENVTDDDMDYCRPANYANRQTLPDNRDDLSFDKTQTRVIRSSVIEYDYKNTFDLAELDDLAIQVLEHFMEQNNGRIHVTATDYNAIPMLKSAVELFPRFDNVFQDNCVLLFDHIASLQNYIDKLFSGKNAIDMLFDVLMIDEIIQYPKENYIRIMNQLDHQSLSRAIIVKLLQNWNVTVEQRFGALIDSKLREFSGQLFMIDELVLYDNELKPTIFKIWKSPTSGEKFVQTLVALRMLGFRLNQQIADLCQKQPLDLLQRRQSISSAQIIEYDNYFIGLNIQKRCFVSMIPMVTKDGAILKVKVLYED